MAKLHGIGRTGIKC